MEAPVVASLISFAGTSVTAAVAYFAFSRTLRFNREKQNQDRELSLRKDVIISLVDSLSDALFYIGTLFLKGTDFNEANAAFRRFNLLVNRIQVVGSSAVIEKFADFQIRLTVAWRELVPRKLRMIGLEGRVATLEKAIDEADGDDVELRESAKMRINELEDAWERDQAEARKRTLAFIENIQDAQTALILVTRSELQMAIEENQYRGFRKQFWADLVRAVPEVAPGKA